MSRAEALSHLIGWQAKRCPILGQKEAGPQLEVYDRVCFSASFPFPVNIISIPNGIDIIFLLYFLILDQNNLVNIYNAAQCKF